MKRKIGFTFLVLTTYYIATSFLSCQSRNEINSDEVLRLKRKYDIATINYFYETVFHEDFNDAKSDNLLKWNSDPKIVLVGNPSETELGYVKKAISRINRLNLLIKCVLEAKSDTNSIEIFFGNVKEVGAYLQADSLIQKDIDTTSHFGLAYSISYDDILSKVNIGICYNEKDTLRSIRENVVLEEIVQSLGINGDSYTYPGSLFFQNDNPTKSFTKLDQDVLSLLYEPAIPTDYPRVSFEKNFADVLHHVDTKRKIKDLLRKFPENRYSIDDVEACFTKGELLKHPREVGVHLHGSIQKEDSATLKTAIVAINKISPNLNVRLAQSRTSEPDYGIILNLKQINYQEAAIQGTSEVIKGSSCMFPKLIKYKTTLSFNGSEKSRKFRQQSIIEALYFSLVQMPRNRLGANKLFEVREDTVDFNKYYADLLSLIYSEEFVDGLKLTDFRKIKSTITK